MLIITTEEKAMPIFKKYEACIAVSLAKGAKGIKDEEGKIIVNYETLSFLPSEDTINGILAGDITLKKVIKKIKKSIENPSMKVEDADTALGVTQLVTILTSDRKNPVVMVVIVDENDPKRTKILLKVIKEALGLFGIESIPMKAIRKAKLFKGKIREIKDGDTKKKIKKIKKKNKKTRRKIAARVARFSNNTKGCRLSKKGADLKKLLMRFYELELRQSGMSNLEINNLDRDETKACVKNLIGTFTATNLQSIASKKTCKRLAKKDRKAVKAYNEVRDILRSMDSTFKLPKVSYGQKKKKGKPIGPKMDVKKFVKYFAKKSHRPALIIIYGHILTRLLKFKVGSKDYNSYMKGVCEPFGAEFAKAYVSAASAFAKANATT